MQLKIIIGVIIFTLVTSGAGLFYSYYITSQATIATLQKNNANLNTAIDINEKTISSLEDSYQKVTEELQTLNTEFQSIRGQNQQLQEKLSDNDLGYLASQKPGLVERIINNATDKAGRCFELLSGAELTDDERNAKTTKAANSECPWFFDSRIDADTAATK